jgi:hypothetical protein
VEFLSKELNEDDQDATGDKIKATVGSLDSQLKMLKQLKLKMEEMVSRKRSEMGDKSLISLDKPQTQMCEQDSDESDDQSL